MEHITRKDIIHYVALPQIKPRLEAFLSSGFQFIAYFIALVYSAVRLLPENHPYLNAKNIGHFGIRHVIAEAANNLTFDRRHIDQIILFASILLGLVLIILQIGLLIMSVTVQPALASAVPTSFAGFFVTQNPTTDLAYMMMDMVFGIQGTNGDPGFFNSCIAQQITCEDVAGDPILGTIGPGAGQSTLTPLGQGFPFPIHFALHNMFAIYSSGLLVVATFISIYFMITVVAETAQTGTAFGKRFNKVWAPIRIVVAFGLLVPIGATGLNSSQYIVLHAAKLGSSFATNGWVLFNNEITSASVDGLATGESLAAAPSIPEVGALLEFMFIARTCYYLYLEGTRTSPGGGPDTQIDMYAVRGPSPTGGSDFLLIGPNTAYDDLISFANGSSKLIFRFGERKAEFTADLGGVVPTCGEIVMNLNDPRPRGEAVVGTLILQEHYLQLLQRLWYTAFENIDGENYPRNIALKHLKIDRDVAKPPAEIRGKLQEQYRKDLTKILDDQVIPGLAASPRYNVDQALVDRGWAGAAIWYNRIAELNGAITSAVFNIPLPSKYPEIMEHIQKEKKKQDNNDPSPKKRFEPKLSNELPIAFERPEDATYASALWEAFQFWTEGNQATSTHIAPTGNAIIDAINALFGTEGLYNIRNNPNVHPLAQIVSVGRGLVEASIRNLTIAVAGGAAGLLANLIDQFIGKTISVASTFLVTIAMVGLTAGFILFYVVPFLPFIYFFFALGGWVKGIFEAMVGAPLWALAHIRIDGEGLTGQAAVSGYFLIFEIFLRPILMIFGMLASISIFSALVSILNQIFDLITSNLGGFDSTDPESTIEFARSAVDEFFFTLIYTIIIYLMALSSFKLIDLIPNNILRWMGQSVSTFNDQREDAAQTLVGKSTIGAQQASSALGKGLGQIAGAGG